MAELILENGVFRARAVPECGGNVVSLCHLASGAPLLKSPRAPEELKRFPARFGMPVLFPPNRIADGSFTFGGRRCSLPINEAATHNHLHGLVLEKPWELLRAEDDAAELRFAFTSAAPEYRGFPFAFTLKRRVELTRTGLLDRMTVTNDGDREMPLGLGYHTTFPAPVKMRLAAGSSEIVIGDRFLPTGESAPWREFDPRRWFDPKGRNSGFHTRSETLTREDGSLLHGAELLYDAGLLLYATDEKFSFWYTWNKRGEGDFISVEPISWMADALNREDPASAGVRVLAPGGEAVFCNELVFFARG